MSALRLLLDQMIDTDVAADLRAAGHDVCCAAELGMARADDPEILEVAIRENRVLVTLDEDFGDWAILPLARHPGVIRVKADPTTTEIIESVLCPFLRARTDQKFRDHLVIVGSTRVRWIRTGGEGLAD